MKIKWREHKSAVACLCSHFITLCVQEIIYLIEFIITGVDVFFSRTFLCFVRRH